MHFFNVIMFERDSELPRGNRFCRGSLQRLVSRRSVLLRGFEIRANAVLRRIGFRTWLWSDWKLLKPGGVQISCLLLYPFLGPATIADSTWFHDNRISSFTEHCVGVCVWVRQDPEIPSHHRAGDLGWAATALLLFFRVTGNWYLPSSRGCSQVLTATFCTIRLVPFSRGGVFMSHSEKNGCSKIGK